MKMSVSFKQWSSLFLAILMFSGCSTTTVARDFNGLPTSEGKPIGHLSTSNMAVHLMFGKKPVWGNASLEQTVADFTAAAKAENASKVHIVQSSQQKWWFILFPFTLLVTPVTSNVAGEAIQ